ncbi:glycosyltransferase family 4 protein [Winogradskyella flava]|uniref:Glycosyltransferase family 4 protein n=1 Tax=Winogradskyella flava TaxID=1884876 RepID=A0A842IQK2_9FLAO|nr:glycosyltransferase family 4 protein [Winogradskyella flava]MBC2844489.1 glycosyltransferase family 4 protein [Winogradskyella flava]
MKKLAIVSTHPIQYYAPWFRLLAERKKIDLNVFYTWSQSETQVDDKNFGKTIIWDIPLLSGYNYTFVENISKKPGSHHFFGIDCPSLIKGIVDYAPDVILIFGWNFKAHLNVLRYFSGKTPIWFRGDSTLLDETKSLKTILRRGFLKWVYRHVDKALFVGEANKKYFLKHGLKSKQLIYAPHAIDNNRFSDDDSKKYRDKALKWRKDLGYSDNDIIVLFVGKFQSKKQPVFLLQAFIKAIEKTHQPLKLLFIGNGPLEDELKSQSKPYQSVYFLPFQNQSLMPLVYRLGDVFCLPSKGPGETWGLAVNEAMACGKPVIVSDKVGCAEDLVEYSDVGFKFNHNNMNELAVILARLNKKDLKRKASNAKNRIKDHNFVEIVKAIENNI